MRHDQSPPTCSARADLVSSSGAAVATLRDSCTLTFSQPFELSTELIETAEERTPEVGAPAATIIHLVTLALAVLVAARGALRPAELVC